MRHLALGELHLELVDELVDDAAHDRGSSGANWIARVEPVAELGAEHVLEGLVVVADVAALAEADARLARDRARRRCWS